MKKLQFIFLCLVLPISGVSHSAPITCHGTVGTLLVYGDGSVNMRASYRGNYTYICNLKTERNGVSITTCATWVGVIETARKMNQEIWSYYYTDSSFTSCADIPTYSASPAPVYIGH